MFIKYKTVNHIYDSEKSFFLFQNELDNKNDNFDYSVPNKKKNPLSFTCVMCIYIYIYI